MKVKREELINLVSKKVFQTSNIEGLEKTGQELETEGKFSFIDFQNLKVNFSKLELLDNSEIFWIVEVASKYIKAIKSPENYFEEAEIKNAKFYVKKGIEKIDYPIVFENVEDLAPNQNRQFGFYLTVKQISLLKSNRLLEVIPNLQRGGKKNKYGDLVIDTNPDRYRAIKKVIEEGNYFYDQIKINLMNDENSDFLYDPINRTLTVFSGTMIIPDGNHRTIACELTDLENVNANNKFSIAFTFLTVAQTKALIDQTWNMQPIKPRQKDSMAITASNLILDAVIRNPEADPIYANNIVRGDMGKDYQNGFIFYNITSNYIDKYYQVDKIETQLLKNNLAKWLVEFFNVLTSILIDDFKNFKNSNKTRWAANPYTFVGYIMISKYLYTDDNWQNKLKRIIESIDFSNTNSPIKNQLVKSKEKSVEIFFSKVIENAEIL